jgi:hypothetical protein
MCEFFSFIMCRNGGIHYHNAKQRKAMKKSEDNPDSHAQIAKTFGLKEDDCLKFEYTPGDATVIVDHCPEWAEDDEERHIADAYLTKATVFATKFDFKEIFPLWPDNFAKLKVMKRVRRSVPQQLSPKVMRCIRDLSKGVRDADIRPVYVALGKAGWYVVKKVANACSRMPLNLDHLRALQHLGWLDLIYKPGTKRRKRIEQILQVIDAGIHPLSIKREARMWGVSPAGQGRSYSRYIVNAAGVTKRVGE